MLGDTTTHSIVKESLSTENSQQPPTNQEPGTRATATTPSQNFARFNGDPQSNPHHHSRNLPLLDPHILLL